MPARPRPNMRDATTPAGARAFFGDEPPAEPTPPPAPETATPTRWDEKHSRWTVHLSNEVIAAVNAAAEATGRSRASLTEAALRADPTIAAHLG